MVSLSIPYGWYAVGYSDELPVGGINNLDYFSRKLVLFRGESGGLNLVGAYCPHLGAHLGHGGKIVSDSIQCPFHGWRFDGDGFCVDIPYANKIPPKASGKACLQSYPVQEVNGIIWAWYHPDNAEPLFDVERMQEMDSGEWTEYQKFSWRMKSHVQETGENAVDTAHFATVHGLGEVAGKPEITFDKHKRVSDLKIGLAKIDSSTGQLVEGEFIEGSIYTACTGPGQTWTIQAGFADVIIIGTPTPINETELELRFACATPKAQTGNQALLAQAIIDNIADQVQQDIPIWENKIYLEQPVLCDGDGPIAQYRKWFQQFYA